MGLLLSFHILERETTPSTNNICSICYPQLEKSCNDSLIIIERLFLQGKACNSSCLTRRLGMDVCTSFVTFAPSVWLETSLIIRSSPRLLFLFLSPSIEPIFMDLIKSFDVIMSCLYLAYFVSQNLSQCNEG